MRGGGYTRKALSSLLIGEVPPKATVDTAVSTATAKHTAGPVTGEDTEQLEFVRGGCRGAGQLLTDGRLRPARESRPACSTPGR